MLNKYRADELALVVDRLKKLSGFWNFLTICNLQYGSMRFTMRSFLPSSRAGYKQLYAEVWDEIKASQYALPPSPHRVVASCIFRAAPRQVWGNRRTTALNTGTDGMGSPDSLGALPGKHKIIPSSGIAALYMALQMCEQVCFSGRTRSTHLPFLCGDPPSGGESSSLFPIQVHVYGFSVDAPRDAPSHYFKEEKPYGVDITRPSKSHDYQMQARQRVVTARRPPRTEMTPVSESFQASRRPSS